MPAAEAAGRTSWRYAALIAALFLAALVLNRGSLSHFFSGDDLDTLSWAPVIGSGDFVRGFFSLEYSPSNFRPVGAALYRVLGKSFGIDYRPFAIALILIHAANIALFTAVARQFRLLPPGIALAAAFLIFHPATLDAYWNFLYVFDMLCGLFWLLALWLYVRGHWLAGAMACLVCYRSKELALMLPLVLTAYEVWTGSRRWVRLLPYFAIALWFGGQIALSNTGRDDAYRLRFTFDAFRACAGFYAGEALLIPGGAAVAIAAAMLLRDRLAWIGVAAFVSPLLPMLFLPGRIHSMYLYVPLFGLAVVIAAIARRVRPRWILAAAGIWIACTLAPIAARQQTFREAARVNRAYFDAVRQLSRQHPELLAVVYVGAPPSLNPWGIEGAVRVCYGAVFPVFPALDQAAGKTPLAVLSWQPGQLAPAIDIRAR